MPATESPDLPERSGRGTDVTLFGADFVSPFAAGAGVEAVPSATSVSPNSASSTVALPDGFVLTPGATSVRDVVTGPSGAMPLGHFAFVVDIEVRDAGWGMPTGLREALLLHARFRREFAQGFFRRLSICSSPRRIFPRRMAACAAAGAETATTEQATSISSETRIWDLTANLPIGNGSTITLETPDYRPKVAAIQRLY